MRNLSGVAQRFPDDRLHLVWRRVVARAHLYVDAQVPGGRGIVRDGVFRQHAVGHHHEISGLRAHFRRTPSDFAHPPILGADGHPIADTERLFHLDGEAGEQVAQRVLQREPDHHGAHRRCGEDALLKNQRGGHREERDHERVLDDVRKALGKAIDVPRIDGKGNDEINHAEREQQRDDAVDLLAGIRRQRQPGERSRRHRVDGEQACRQKQAPANVAVDRRPPEDKRRQKTRKANHHADVHVATISEARRSTSWTFMDLRGPSWIFELRR